MKAKIFISAFVIIILALYSCRNDDNPEPEPEKSTYIQKQVTSSGTTTYHYDTNNRITLEKYENAVSSLQIISENTYNNAGQIIERLEDETDNPLNYKYVYHYNVDGKLSKMEMFTIDSGGTATLYRKKEADYSVPGKISVKSNLPSGTALFLEYEYFVDSAGNITKELEYKPSGALDGVTEYLTYDDRKSPSQLLPKTAFVSSVNNNLTFEYTNYAGVIGNYTVSYEYNEENYPTKRTLNTGSTTTYEYIKK